MDGQIRPNHAVGERLGAAKGSLHSPAIEATGEPPPSRGRRLSPLVYGALAVLAGGGALLRSHLRVSTDTEWTSVVLWAVSLVLMTVACLPRADRNAPPTPWSRAGLAAILSLIVLACCLLLPALAVYPLEVASDPPRDSGFLTQTIADGRTRQIFKWGYFNGFSFVMPLTGVPFYWVFGPSSLSFKALAALLGIVTPGLLYLAVRRHLSRGLALAAGVLMLSLPVYLFYARREPIHAFNPFWMMAVLGALLGALERRTGPRELGLVGMVAGLTVHFHPAVKAAAFCAVALAAVTAVCRTLARRQSWRSLFGAGITSITGFLLGLGPLLLVTDLGILLSSGRRASSGHDLATILDRYQVSLRVFFDQPTASWFPTHMPLIPTPTLAALFALGVVLGFLVVPLRVHLALVFFLLVLPFTNSAMTDIVNGDHRLSPLLPVVAWVMAIGLAVLWRATSRVRPAALRGTLRVVVVAVFATAAAQQVYRFFDQEQARHDTNVVSHLMHFALREIESTPELRDAPEVCIEGSRFIFDHMMLPHFREGWAYYLPGKTVRFAELLDVADNKAIFLTASCNTSLPPEQWRERVLCSPRQRFVCPGREAGSPELRVYVDRNLPTPPPRTEQDQRAGRVEVADRPTLPGAITVRRGRRELPGLTRLDVTALLSTPGISIRVNDPAFEPRIRGAFDRSEESVGRSEGINPLVIDLQLESPIRLSSARLLVTASPHAWVVEPAAGKRYLAAATPGEWSQLDLPRVVETSSVHIEILRQERDDYVHVAEIELYTDP